MTTASAAGLGCDDGVGSGPAVGGGDAAPAQMSSCAPDETRAGAAPRYGQDVLRSSPSTA
jgi:hypothetical protein